MAFQTVGAEARPIQVCVGSLKGDVGALKQSKPDPENPHKTLYYYNELAIKGEFGAQDIKARMLWLPGWFNPKLSLRTLDPKQQRVFANTISSQEGTTLLQGLCGDAATWTAFQEEFVAGVTDYTADNVDDFIRSFFHQLGPVQFMYELRQERKKAGFDTDGKQLYVRGRYLEVAGLEWITAGTLKALANRLTRNRKKIADAVEAGTEPPVLVVAKFNPLDLGYEVEFPVDEEPSWVAA